MLSQRWTYHLMTIFFVFIFVACASYPDEPRRPIVENDTYSVNEDEFLAVTAEEGILSNDRPQEGINNNLIEVNGQDTTAAEQVELELEGGKLVLKMDGSFTYEPSQNFNGQDEEIAYTVQNDKGKKNSGTLVFNVTPVNDAPRPENDTLTISSSQTVLDVLANDVDPDGDTISISQIEGLENGTATISDDGATIIFTPNASHNGAVSFNYIVTDGAGATAKASVLLTSDNSNNILQPDTISVEEDGFVTMSYDDLLANDDAVVAGAEMTFGRPQNGTVVPGNNRTFTYTPALNFSGTDYFTYTVEIDGGQTYSTMVTVQVSEVEDAPTISAIDDQTTTVGQTIGPIPFTLSDTDGSVDDLTLTYAISNAVPVGLVPEEGITIYGSGENRAMWITPAANLSGSATITLTVSNGVAESSESFQLTVSSASNQAPNIAIVGDIESVIAANASTTVNFTIQDPDTAVLALSTSATSSNTTLIPNDSQHLAIGGESDATGSRSLTITPATDQTGTTQITISVSDGINIANLRFDLQVTAVGNTAPVIASIASRTIGVNDTVNIALDITDETSAAYLSFGISVRSSVSGIISDGAISFPYDEAGDYRSLVIQPPFQEGTATITLTVRDPEGLSTQTAFDLTFVSYSVSSDSSDLSVSSLASDTDNTLTVQSTKTPTLSSVNLSGQGTDNSYQTVEDTSLAIGRANGILNLVSDSLKQTSIIASSSQSSHFGGEVQIASNGGFVYTPPRNFTGQDTFTYSLKSTNTGQSVSSGNVTITVTAVNDAPLAENDLYGTALEKTLTVASNLGVLANDRDVEDQSLQVTPQKTARWNLRADGGFTYTPPAGFSGKDTLTYSVSDGVKRSQATVTLFVGNNSIPSVRPDSYRMTGTTLTKKDRSYGVLANDSDPQGQTLTIKETGVFETLFGGEVNIATNGGFTYQPPPDFNGFDSFIYKATDGTHQVAGSAVISVTP